METTCRERPDLSGLASRWWYPLLASLCVALPVVLARRGRVSWSSVAVGASLGVALLMPAYLLLSAALRR